MQRLEVSGAVQPIYGSLGVKRLIADEMYTVEIKHNTIQDIWRTNKMKEDVFIAAQRYVS